jgi:hypothetical protein
MVLLGWRLILVGIIIRICFFRGAYSLYLYSIVNHGDINNIAKNAMIMDIFWNICR